MKKKIIAILVVLISVIGIAFISYLRYSTDVAIPYLSDLSKIEDDVLILINRKRMSMDLPVLLRDGALDLIAIEWSKSLAENNTVSHGNFEERVSQIGYANYLCGEIIAKRGGWTTGLASDLVDMWLASPEHYEVMMTSSEGYMGVGISDSIYGFFAVVDFRFV